LKVTTPARRSNNGFVFSNSLGKPVGQTFLSVCSLRSDEYVRPRQARMPVPPMGQRIMGSLFHLGFPFRIAHSSFHIFLRWVRLFKFISHIVLLSVGRQ